MEAIAVAQETASATGVLLMEQHEHHAGSDTILVFLGLERRKGGGGPTLFSFNKNSGETRNLGPLFSADSPYSWSTGEGWYFSGTRPNAMYLNDGARMLRYDVRSHSLETVFDVRDHLARKSLQMHSSNDDRVHSATVATPVRTRCSMLAIAKIRARSYDPARGRLRRVPDRQSGAGCIKEKSTGPTARQYNLDLRRPEQVFLDQDGAAGHSDQGTGPPRRAISSRPGAVSVCA